MSVLKDLEEKFPKMMMKGRVKSSLLFFTVVISQLPTVFFGTKDRINLSLFVERSTRLDFAAMYYANAVNFMILAYCLFKPEGVDSRVKKLIFIITVIDFIHLALFAGRGFGESKIAIAVLVYFLIEWKKV